MSSLYLNDCSVLSGFCIDIYHILTLFCLYTETTRETAVSKDNIAQPPELPQSTDGQVQPSDSSEASQSPPAELSSVSQAVSSPAESKDQETEGDGDKEMEVDEEDKTKSKEEEEQER